MHEAALDHLWWLHQVLLTAPFCGPCNHRIIDRCHDNKACRCVLRWNGLLVVSHPASFPDLLQTRLSLPPEARTRSWAAPSLAYGNPAISHLHRPVAASRSHSRCLHFLLSRPPPESTPAFAEGHKSRVSATAIIHHPGCPVEPLTNASTSSCQSLDALVPCLPRPSFPLNNADRLHFLAIQRSARYQVLACDRLCSAPHTQCDIADSPCDVFLNCAADRPTLRDSVDDTVGRRPPPRKIAPRIDRSKSCATLSIDAGPTDYSLLSTWEIDSRASPQSYIDQNILSKHRFRPNHALSTPLLPVLLHRRLPPTRPDPPGQSTAQQTQQSIRRRRFLHLVIIISPNKHRTADHRDQRRRRRSSIVRPSKQSLPTP